MRHHRLGREPSVAASASRLAAVRMPARMWRSCVVAARATRCRARTDGRGPAAAPGRAREEEAASTARTPACPATRTQFAPTSTGTSVAASSDAAATSAPQDLPGRARLARPAGASHGRAGEARWRWASAVTPALPGARPVAAVTTRPAALSASSAPSSADIAAASATPPPEGCDGEARDTASWHVCRRPRISAGPRRTGAGQRPWSCPGCVSASVAAARTPPTRTGRGKTHSLPGACLADMPS
mmetsp:Transcript_2718/g.10965  ORF Transcript_2718/g.10965 Transcript_2718/m.10965 type:complete len:244 (-) Transcript_2718:189-920(-)